MTARQQPFKLSVQLEGHSADVRSVSCTDLGDPNSPLLLSGSRDSTAKVWGKLPGTKSKRDMGLWHTLEGQSGFVNCTAWLRKGSEVIALAGGQDHTINAYHVSSATASTSSTLSPDYTLLGHEDNVCALHVYEGRGNYIVSGSWDKTARIWKDWQCVAVLQGHTQAVWAVLALDEDTVLTASADKVIRQYSISQAIKDGETESKPIATYVGHTDAVRGLQRIDKGTFASCGNDGNIHIYKIHSSAASGGAQVQPWKVLSGHTSFVYSLASVHDGPEIASSGEDRSVRIWGNGEMQQTITIPAISVWSVGAVSNGDIACASSDNFVRVFTRTPQRFADDDILAAYDAAVSSQSLNKAQVGDVQKDSLPGVEALAVPGREGQVKMVRVGEMVEAHQFNSSSGGWEKIGEVVGGVGSSQKKLHDGKEYDYVFDVDIADGVPPLKLPYNASENPYSAAQRFLEKNDLPSTYLDQVVQFIEKNTSGVSLGGGEEFRDPYTGASSYRPGATTASAAASTPVAPAASASVARTAATTSILPHRTALTFKQFNAQGAMNKIVEFNGHLADGTATTQEEMSAIKSLLSTLAEQAPQVNAQYLATLAAVLQRWPVSSRFPLLDVYRVACCYVKTNVKEAANAALLAAQWTEAWPTSAEESKSRTTSSLLALRAVANAIPLVDVNSSLSILQVLTLGSAHVPRLSKAARGAFATVLLNASITLHVNKDAELARVLLSLVSTSAQAELSLNASDRDVEAIYRLTMSLGNVLVSSTAGSLGIGDVRSAVEPVQQAVNGSKDEERLQVLWREIKSKSQLI